MRALTARAPEEVFGPAARPRPPRSVPVRGGDGPSALLSVLKGLEIQKTLGSEPVLAALRHFPAQPARVVDFPAELHPKLRDTLAGRGYEGLYSHQREAFELVQGGKDVVVVTPDRLGQDPLLQPPGPRPHPQGPRRAGALPLPDEGAGPGPARRAPRGGRGDRGRHRHVHLRRGHAAGRAQVDPRARARRGHEPRHAAQGHPAAPHQVGEAAREPALRRDRRAAQPARGLRLARHEHPAPAAAAVRVLRLAAAVHLLLGHDREPEGAGRGPDRARDEPRRRERRAAGRALLRDLQPAGREPPARHPQVRAQLGARRLAVVPRQGPADDRVRPVPARDRGARDLPQGGARDEAGLGGRHPRLPRRLPAAEAPRDRAGAARGLGARRRVHERARARDRHRQPRRGGAGGLPGQRRLGVAAGGPGRAALGDVGRRADRELDPAQPVHREEPRLLLRGADRAGPRSTPRTCRSWSTT